MAFEHICELQWSFIHTFIHSLFIYFNNNLVSLSLRDFEDSAGSNKVGPPSDRGWQPNPRMLETYHMLIPWMSLTLQILILMLLSKQLLQLLMQSFIILD